MAEEIHRRNRLPTQPKYDEITFKIRLITMLEKSEYINLFEQINDPGISYLLFHAERFMRTKQLVSSGGKSAEKTNLLDITSHWLHNAFLYSRDGYNVTGCDLAGGEISVPAVIKFARDQGISLIPCQSLQDPTELDQISDGLFDIVMFSESIEHITFNPVKLWTMVYKKMKEGGKIIITTPNYYCVRGSFTKDIKKLFRGNSTGIAINDIIEMHDRAPHWKEYSKKDIVDYFAALSPDFKISRVVFNDLYGWQSVGRAEELMQRLFPGFFYPTMYIEVELPKKNAGIVAVPHW